MYGDLAEFWPLVSPPEDYAEEVATFRARFSRQGVPDGGSVLHLGCGGGSIDHHLKRHYRVTGVDRSEQMLGMARRLNPDVQYCTGDMREVRLGRTFDAVLVHDAISHMTSVDELRAAYRTAAAHLRPGGVMVALPEELRSRLRVAQPTMETHSGGGRSVTLVEVSHDQDPADSTYEQVYIFVVQDGAGVRVEVDRHVHGVFDIEEFTGAMVDAGFAPVVEEWELSSWKEGEAPMPLVTATRIR